MSSALQAVNDSALPPMQKNRLYNFVAEQDTSTTRVLKSLKTDTRANTAQALVWFEPIENPLSVFMGIMAVALVVIVGLTTVIDVCYISLPVVHAFITGISKTDDKPIFVSKEAYNAMAKAYDTGNEASSAYLKDYLFARSKFYLLLGIALVVLITGALWDYLLSALSWLAIWKDTLPMFQ